MNYSEFDLDQVALTVWAEARGESVEGQKAVIHVIRNRYEKSRLVVTSSRRWDS